MPKITAHGGASNAATDPPTEGPTPIGDAPVVHAEGALEETPVSGLEVLAAEDSPGPPKTRPRAKTTT